MRRSVLTTRLVSIEARVGFDQGYGRAVCRCSRSPVRPTTQRTVSPAAIGPDPRQSSLLERDIRDLPRRGVNLIERPRTAGVDLRCVEIPSLARFDRAALFCYLNRLLGSASSFLPAPPRPAPEGGM